MLFHRLINSVQEHDIGLLYFHLGLIFILIGKYKSSVNYLYLEGILYCLECVGVENSENS